MNIEGALAELRRVLIQRQLASGGWPALACSSQTVTEPTAYAMIALGPGFQNEYQRARHCLLHSQNPNGSWPAFIGDDQDGSWATALASIALSDRLEDIPVRLRALKWLLHSAGKESSWIWRWKFRTADRHVRFDPEKFGWPWQPATNSWVVPTAFAILVLNQLSCSCGMEHSGLFRTQRGVEMLLDRVCPMGGWNAGNGVVYGTSLTPHPDDTAIALLALKDHANEPAVIKSLEWLEATAPNLQAPWSLAWSLVAFAAYSRNADRLLDSLAKLIDPTGIQDIATLAVAALALDYQRFLSLLKS